MVFFFDGFHHDAIQIMNNWQFDLEEYNLNQKRKKLDKKRKFYTLFTNYTKTDTKSDESDIEYCNDVEIEEEKSHFLEKVNNLLLISTIIRILPSIFN